MSSVETVKGWARQIHSESEIPTYFLNAFEDLNLDAIEFPLVLLSPAFKFGRDEITEKLLVRSGERIACMDRRKGLVKITEVSVGDIHSAEWGTVLLQSWIGFHALGPLGPASTGCFQITDPVHAFKGLSASDTAQSFSNPETFRRAVIAPTMSSPSTCGPERCRSQTDSRGAADDCFAPERALEQRTGEPWNDAFSDRKASPSPRSASAA
jgi:hypothetical protein